MSSLSVPYFVDAFTKTESLKAFSKPVLRCKRSTASYNLYIYYWVEGMGYYGERADEIYYSTDNRG